MSPILAMPKMESTDPACNRDLIDSNKSKRTVSSTSGSDSRDAPLNADGGLPNHAMLRRNSSSPRNAWSMTNSKKSMVKTPKTSMANPKQKPLLTDVAESKCPKSKTESAKPNFTQEKAEIGEPNLQNSWKEGDGSESAMSGTGNTSSISVKLNVDNTRSGYAGL